MIRLCPVYEVECVCRTCSKGTCSRSPMTKRDAEIIRGVLLDRDGAVLSRPATYSAPITVDPAFLRTPGRKAASQAQKQRRTIAAICITAVVLTLSYTVYFIYGFFTFEPKPTPEDLMADSAEATNAAAVNAPARATAQQPTATPPNGAVVASSALPKANLLPLGPVAARPDTIVEWPSWQPVLANETGMFVPPERMKDVGNAHVKKHDYEVAQKFFESSVKANPDYFEGWNNLANTLADTGSINRAEPLYRKGLALAPDSTVLHFNRGNTLYRLGRHAEALQEFQTVLQSEPDDRDALLLSGNCLYHLERYAEAAAQFQALLADDPMIAEANYNLALTFAKEGKPSLAKQFRDQATRLNPDIANGGEAPPAKEANTASLP
ncbi:hypothetical protein BH09SUM1_BH09SUM1_32480 [soil metagenome]